MESPLRKTVIRGGALLAILITFTYLGWRVSGTIDLRVWWLALPLFVVELHNAFGLVLYTFALWEVGKRPPSRRVHHTDLRVAVLIPTYNEPQEVLLPTIAAAVVLEPAHETWVLDDGDRAEIRELAAQLGARYLARPEHNDAKAGNLNHALGAVDVDIVAVLDADHVPTRNFLINTLGYFDDPQVALVQTPQSFYNLESFEHERHGDGHFNEESVFYRVIAPAKNRWAAPFWCGTCALVRVDALRSVGGVATESVTEDIQTTIRMYRRGWKGVFHNEILAHGLAPADSGAYLGQRNRWATGAMQVLRLENPLFGRGLRIGQRIAFMTTLFAWFDSWRMLAYMLLPIMVVLSGASPIAAPGYIFGPFFILTLASQFVALRLLARGHYPPILSMLFEVLRMPAVLPATLTLLRRDVRRPFWVTPKGRRTEADGPIPVPRLLSVLAIASAAAMTWFVLSALGLTPLRYHEAGSAIGAAFFLAVNLALLTAAISRIRAARFAGERRAAVRFDVRVPGRLGARRCVALDVSLTGAQVVVPAGAQDVPARPVLELEINQQRLELACSVQRIRTQADGSAMIGLAYAPGQKAAIRRLALAMFGADEATWQPVGAREVVQRGRSRRVAARGVVSSEA